MKVYNIHENKPILNINHNKKTTSICFTGLKKPTTKCMFVFDLDGTLANGTKDEIKKIIEIANKRDANLVYATGRNKKEVEKLQQKLAENGIFLPNPDYLICNNGQFLYENIDGILVKNIKYEAQLRANTNFDSKKVLIAIKKLANSDKYKFTHQQLSELGKLNNYEQIKAKDPDFYKSKISYYEWNASEFMSEYFVGSGVPLKELKKDIQTELSKLGIKTKFIENQYTKPIMDACSESILLQSHPLRRHNDGSMTALFLCPADKADGIKYLKKHLEIPYNEILMAGNDDNDVAMAQLSRQGAYFICLNNASYKLKQIASSLRGVVGNIFIATKEGAKGILEGMSKIIE